MIIFDTILQQFGFCLVWTSDFRAFIDVVILVSGETDEIQEHPGPRGLRAIPPAVPAVQWRVLDPLPNRHVV